ncbi:Hexaprenyldihydroxybenzoate methyltransferase, mitochondrial [Rhizina undulata]
MLNPRIPRLSPRLTSCLLRATQQYPLPRQSRTHSTSSVDPTEISHFNALASTWWDPHGSSRLLHLMNPLRLQFLQSCLLRGSPITQSLEARLEQGADEVAAVVGRETKGLRYLDVGCGGGILAESLARLENTRSVVGVDPSSEVLAVAKEHMRQDPGLEGRLRYVNTTIEGLGEVLGKEGLEGKFDVVTLMEVIEHVPRPSEFLTNCMTHVKPGGWLLLSTIARTWTSYLTTKLVAEDILGIVPRGTHDWNKYINYEELREFFAKQKGWGGEDGKDMVVMGCVYVPGAGWMEVTGGEKVGNYFFGVRKNSK